MARPTKYNDEVLEKARDYIENYNTYGNQVPSIAGLAIILDVARITLYDWAESYDEFSYILDKVKVMQESLLIDGGLSGDFNSNIVKLMLGKHGYHEKRDINAAIKKADEFEYVDPDESTEEA